jgi:curved DNA-binding protein
VKDYYQILGVPRTATDDDIRQAFRKLAMRHHPDRGGDSSRFQEINEAHSVLGDPEKRRAYDQPAPRFQGFSTNPGFQGFGDFQDIFDYARQQARQTHARLTLWISLRDAALGGQRTVTIGNPAGVSGARIDIPLAVNDGDHVQYPRLGPGGCDLVVTFRITPEPGWSRQGLDLITNHRVSVWTLITGGQIQVKDILGREYALQIPPRTQPGTSMRMANRGLRDSHNNTGALLVRLDAHIPDDISPQLIEAIQNHS